MSVPWDSSSYICWAVLGRAVRCRLDRLPMCAFNRHSSQFTITFRMSTHKHITRSDARIITKHGVVAASATSILFSVIGPSINLPSRYYITRRVGVSWKLGQAKTKRPGKSWPWRQRQIGVVGGEKRVIENASRT